MSGDLVLITGVTGFLRFRILTIALESNYRVRAAVRSQAKADTILSNPVLKCLNLKLRPSFVIVPDITVPGAYDDAVMDPERYEEELITPTVQGTKGMFEAALKAPTVSRIVLTSSIITLLTTEDAANPNFEEVIGPSRRISIYLGPYDNEWPAYQAGKTRSLEVAETFVAEKKPHFDAVYIHPSFCLGRQDLATKSEDYFTTTNAIMLTPCLGQDMPPIPLPGGTVHIDDAARMHVLALNPKIKGNQSFLPSWTPKGTFDGVVWQDTTSMVARLYPKEIEKGTFPCTGKILTSRIKYDARSTEETFGIVFKSYEEQVKSTVDHYLELLKKERTESSLNQLR